MNNLASILPSIDRLWAIDKAWANSAFQSLSAIDRDAHTAEYLASKSQQPDEGDEPPYEVRNGIAMLSMTGPLMKRDSSWGMGSSTVRLRRMVRQAAADPSVSGIALIVDSPGGSVSGTADLAADILAASDRKPVGAYIEDLGCSAAYWIASQAGLLMTNSTATIGSIGTVMTLVDSSRAYDQAGLKIHVVSTGKHKGAGTRGSAVTEEQLGQFQNEVNSITAQFKASVRAARDLSAEEMDALSDGRCWIGQEAADNGLIDAVGSLDSFMRAMYQLAAARKRGETASRSAIRSAVKDARAAIAQPGRQATSTPAGMSAERRVKLLSATPEGRRVLAEERARSRR